MQLCITEIWKRSLRIPFIFWLCLFKLMDFQNCQTLTQFMRRYKDSKYIFLKCVSATKNSGYKKFPWAPLVSLLNIAFFSGLDIDNIHPLPHTIQTALMVRKMASFETWKRRWLSQNDPILNIFLLTRIRMCSHFFCLWSTPIWTIITCHCSMIDVWSVRTQISAGHVLLRPGLGCLMNQNFNLME